MCDGWRQVSAKAQRDFREPVISDIPSLVLAGGLDSVTPSSWGREVVKGLTNSLYLEYPNAAHAVLYSSFCSNDEVQQFLNPDIEQTAFCSMQERLDGRVDASLF